MQALQVSENFRYDLQHIRYFYAYCFAASYVGKERRVSIKIFQLQYLV